MLNNNSGLYKGRWASSVGLDGPGFKSQLGQEICPFSKTVQIGSGTHPASYSMGSGVLTPGVRRSGHEVDQAPNSSAEGKNERRCTSAFFNTERVSLNRQHLWLAFRRRGVRISAGTQTILTELFLRVSSVRALKCLYSISNSTFSSIHYSLFLLIFNNKII
jgi:hypothetical protein